MAVELTCQCGSDKLTEIPSGENSKAYECKKCGAGILVQHFPAKEEDGEK